MHSKIVASFHYYHCYLATLSSKNPFLVAKTIQAMAGELKKVKRLRDDLLAPEMHKLSTSLKTSSHSLSLLVLQFSPLLTGR